MDSLDDLFELLEGSGTAKRTSQKNKKRRWREIEALKDRQRLRKELEDLDIFADNIDLESIDF
ncbi:DUF3545 family protein [Pseudoalteromonas xiamenensis]|uniref:DUF3545 family protein n=1 Tax=Pseudoalteromonas xiamenensis TaxID=882626 RepID=A0A975DGN7_9GAMM|nr:DUF3545 family protein [Pseudoalteromonas xiamenensis]QTH70880.1 DUF3545 family protein [Pseudoalteromonas xiamenensis]WMN59199.1 DUF3545 family protein [Pseudoalteromonas xiamenensis]